MLDLGPWVSIQAKVEEHHRKLIMCNDVLASSVEHVFNQMLDLAKLLNVYDCWCKILHLILEGFGGNKLVESCRGKKDANDLTELYLGSDNEVVSLDDSDAGSIDSLSNGSNTEMEDKYDASEIVSMSSADDNSTAVSEESFAAATEVFDNYDNESTISEHDTENLLDMEMMDSTDRSIVILNPPMIHM